MAITTTCIVRMNGDIIWFDAILNSTKTYAASVTKHPIERGGVVSDHTTLANPSYSISGVITDADFHRDRPDLATINMIGDMQQDLNDQNGFNIISRGNVLNYDPVDDIVVIKYSENPLTKFLPEAAAKFLDKSAPVVILAEADNLITSATIMENYFTEMQRKKESFTVMEFKDNQLIRYATNCVFTNVSFKVDVGSGDAVYPDLKFESVTYVDSILVKIPQRVTEKLKKKVTPTTNKGSQTGTKTDSSSPAGTDKVPSKVVSEAAQVKDKAASRATGGPTT